MATAVLSNDEEHPPVADLDWYSGSMDFLESTTESEFVSVLGPSQRRFKIQKDWAIRILTDVYDEETSAREHFELLLAVCGSWINHHRNEIESAWLTHLDGKFWLVVTQAMMEHDQALHDALCKLWLDTGRDPLLADVPFDTRLLPPMSVEGLRTFIDPANVLRYRKEDESTELI